MVSEVQKRYDAAVQATLNREIINATDARFHWAQETKVACGIALGFFKSNTVDADSINKCDAFYQLMLAPPPAPAPPPPPPPPPPPEPQAVCSVKLPIVFYFAFDVDTPPAEAAPIVQKTVESLQSCGWTSIKVTGHADRSGTDAYNQKLSERRAQNVAALLTGAGAPQQMVSVEARGESSPAVPTEDGVREPLNRRVEVTAAGGGQ
jgi:OOP family OmpA-OmpF porin